MSRELIFRLPVEACSPHLTDRQNPAFSIITIAMKATGRTEIPMPLETLSMVLERAVGFMRSMGMQGQGRMLIVVKHILKHNRDVTLDLNTLMAAQSLAHRDEHLEIVAAALTREFERDGKTLVFDKFMERLTNGFPTEEHLDSVLAEYADCRELMWKEETVQ